MAIIKLNVNGQYIESNSITHIQTGDIIKLTFDSSWDNVQTKICTFDDAHGVTERYVTTNNSDNMITFTNSSGFSKTIVNFNIKDFYQAKKTVAIQFYVEENNVDISLAGTRGNIPFVPDTDIAFVIDTKKRTIENLTGKSELVQYDHNSERITFNMQRYIDGMDVMNCNRVRIYYENYNDANVQGFYDVDDLNIDTEDNSIVCFSWLISSNVTPKEGIIQFNIAFKIVEADEQVTYAWHTKVDNTLRVTKGFNKESTVAYTYPDVIEQVIESTESKVDKNAGVENAGKYLAVGDDGMVTYKDSVGGSGEITARNMARGYFAINKEEYECVEVASNV